MGMNAVSVTIVLSTYNGACFLPAQLDSLVAQTCGEWRLLARDDSSDDASREILEDFARRLSGKVDILAQDGSRLGPARSFSLLLESVRTPYALLCDQDDVWLPKKLAISLAAMRDTEARFGSERPILVHGDLQVVDENLTALGSSFWKYRGLDPHKGATLSRLLAQNVVTGCTVLVNRALMRRALPIAREAIMHDWWLALVALLFGEVVSVAQPLVLYRQHGSNTLGAKRHSLWAMLPLLRKRQEVDERLRRTTEQAQALLKRYQGDLDSSQSEVLSAYASLLQLTPSARLAWVCKYGFLKTDLLRNLGLVLTLLRAQNLKG
jgi:glycosyltransferase involved in cell wall biosynthesis